MENKDFKISKIYKKIADKTLSFGCRFLDSKGKEHKCILAYDNDIICYGFTKKKHSSKIIGHPVLIGDCLSYFNQKTIGVDYTTNDILKFWTKKRKPIEQQSEDCIDYVFNLLPKE